MINWLLTNTMIFQARIVVIKTLVFLLLTCPAYSYHPYSRRKRFAILESYVKKWTGSENEAPSEDIPEQYQPVEHYIGYRDRPGPMISKLLRWDHRPKHLGPLLSRLVQLTKDIVEETDVVHSVLLSTVGMENTLIHSGGEKKTK